MWMLALLGCVPLDLGKTLVFALDAPPEVQLDADRCATGVGLDLPLGIASSLAIRVADDGQDARLGACDLDAGGAVLACGLLAPEVLLDFDRGQVSGSSQQTLQFQDTPCSGATLDNHWGMTLEDDRLEGALLTTWRLDDTNACEDFEADIIAVADNGRGINGCELRYPFAGQLVARCTSTESGLRCAPP